MEANRILLDTRWQNPVVIMPFPTHAFTGKERDRETGFSYFGARYYDSDLSGLFLSVDPMADKYPSISPYAYCAWSPVKLVDPDGEEIDDYFSFDGKYLGSDNAETNNVRIISTARWNYIQTNRNELIDHDVGYVSSVSFSEASSNSTNSMSTDAQLSVYNHYNTTNYPVTQTQRDNNKTLTAFHTVVGHDKKNDKTTIRLEAFLKRNIRNKSCDNADEIVNSFVHEGDHINKAEKMGYYEYKKMYEEHLNELEQSALSAQMSHPSWFKTSNSFKRGVVKYINSL